MFSGKRTPLILTNVGAKDDDEGLYLECAIGLISFWSKGSFHSQKLAYTRPNDHG